MNFLPSNLLLLNFEALAANEINPNLKLVIEFIGEPGVDEGMSVCRWNI
jgi:hypothetical protein